MRHVLFSSLRKLVRCQLNPMSVWVREVHRVSHGMILKTEGDLPLTEFNLGPLEVGSAETEREMTHRKDVMIRHRQRIGRLSRKECQTRIPCTHKDRIIHAIGLLISSLHPQNPLIPFQWNVLISHRQSNMVKASDMKHRLLLSWIAEGK